MFSEQIWIGWRRPSGADLYDFRAAHTGVKLRTSDFQPWYYTEPNSEPSGDGTENCAGAWAGNCVWVDFKCDEGAASMCEFDQAPKFTLRGKNILSTCPIRACGIYSKMSSGLPANSPFDSRYAWSWNSESRSSVFMGFRSSLLFREQAVWRLRLYENLTNGYYLEKGRRDPLGYNTWRPLRIFEQVNKSITNQLYTHGTFISRKY